MIRRTAPDPLEVFLLGQIPLGDALALQLRRDLVRVVRTSQPDVGDSCTLQLSPVEHGLESAADGLDFGKLRQACRE